MMYHLRILTLLLALLVALPRIACAQTAEEKARIAEQRRIVERLEKEVAASEKALSAIKKDKSTAQQRVKSITRQINSRNQLLSRTEREIGSIERNISLNDSLIAKTNQQIVDERERYAEMVREAYRNYKQNNYITYLLASESFSDVARRIANIRAVAVLRAERLHRIDSLSQALSHEQETLSQRRHSLDSVRGKAKAQREKLQGDVRSAEQAMKQLSTREQKALREQMETEERLDAAIDALRRLTVGNKEGASFSKNTSNLNLPVVGGRVKEYRKAAQIIDLTYGALLGEEMSTSGGLSRT